jgi:hypothetical protein
LACAYWTDLKQRFHSGERPEIGLVGQYRGESTTYREASTPVAVLPKLGGVAPLASGSYRRRREKHMLAASSSHHDPERALVAWFATHYLVQNVRSPRDLALNASMRLSRSASAAATSAASNRVGCAADNWHPRQKR